ncbi:Peptide-N4-(N-acetyl-beta-glucosaminyl)asparagine amidase A [Cytospora mali]|uniref:Peptide-N4-(N-acetyl-beta-glucosaminyl)asparagine amidase A n=1 Tax=Cytospora mali TaxID=578113 RepID=A0A194W8A9_CYTMA|nr:Peptide-N4-(N-acetyl-beta-glucosaminyl)asparagine amidase A [Valsa mali]
MVRITTLAVTLGVLGQCLALKRLPYAASRKSSNSTSGDFLEVVQGAPPPRKSFDGYSCKQTLFENDFANSYGTPFVGQYIPPPANCSFTTTIFNLSVVSKGRQYDRLAQLFFGDVEIWRTSTAMPTETGIYWSFQKDMTVFDKLIREEQKIIFDLGNVVDNDLYTGTYNVTLEALYFDDEYIEGFHPAELIYPISNLTSAENKTSVFSLPDDDGSVSIILPRNIKTAVVSLMASGNSAEEFWYTNVPSEYIDTFPSNEGWLYGYSPFREVQLLIDDQLAGVSWPFPILFTGGVDPGLWRPVVGIDTYDLPSFEIDVTPWLSLLCDGQEHTFKIEVVGFNNSSVGKIGTVGQNWWVTGAVFVWLDETINHTVAGNIKSKISAPVFEYVPQLSTTVSSNGSVTNESLWVSLSARRDISISSTIFASNGTESVVSWNQELYFSNIQNMTNPAYNQSLAMVSSGSYSGSFSEGSVSTYSYPLNLYSAYVIAETDNELSSVFCMIDRSLLLNETSALSTFTGTLLGNENLATRQNATSFYAWNETIVEGLEGLDTCEGETWLSYSGTSGNKEGVADFSRHMREKDDTMAFNEDAWATIAVPTTEPLPVVDGELIL